MEDQIYGADHGLGTLMTATPTTAGISDLHSQSWLKYLDDGDDDASGADGYVRTSEWREGLAGGESGNGREGKGISETMENYLNDTPSLAIRFEEIQPRRDKENNGRNAGELNKEAKKWNNVEKTTTGTPHYGSEQP